MLGSFVGILRGEKIMRRQQRRMEVRKKHCTASSQQEGVAYHERKGGRRGKLGEIRETKEKG